MDSKGPPQYPVSSSVCLDPSTEDDPLVDGPLISPDALHSAIRKEFRTIPTTYSAVLLSLIHVAYVVLSLCVAVMCPLKLGEEQECANVLRNVTGQSTIVFGKVCMSVLVLLFAVYVHRHHNRARSRGYLHFYRNTRRLKHLPLAVHSTVRVARFNRERAVPDVSQEEHCHAYRDAHLTTETGFREGCGLEEVVEKQADLIEYLKQHNTLLSKRLLNQSAQH
ncbi:transmembrane protein 192 isoform X2 [Gadus chalcogrammus]|uniref:transmembrane protein 192 isoform X2 n=1 Tax=Gadus chalcogrammus TaxID=1042646 RepID=UPI0024C2C1FB|nr:transmembrane protein 192 isoform X2 [Gadus chalcogrammus]